MTVNLGQSTKAQWEEEGWCLVEGVFSPEEVRAAQAALPALFPTAEEFAADVDPERNRPFRVDSHSVMPAFPFESSALNRLVLHDKVIDLAQDFLGLHDIRLYQGMLSAKYSKGAPDDEQLLHVDYGNHTLVVPRPEVGYQHLELFIYLSDVTPEKAATRMVSRHLTTDIPIERTYLSPTEYDHLYRAEVPASGPAGSILAYRPDVYHRGVRMTAPRLRLASCCTSRSSPRTPTGSVRRPGPARPRAWPGTASCSRPTCGSSPCWAFPSRATPTGPRRRCAGWRRATRCSTWRRGGRRVPCRTSGERSAGGRRHRPTGRGGRPGSCTRSIPARSPTPTATASGICRGIIEHLDHLEWLGVDGVWLSPVTPSPNADWGYDVSDFTRRRARLRHARRRRPPHRRGRPARHPRS